MRVKIKGLKLSDVDYKNGKATTWGICSKGALTGEGQRLLKKYPQYNYLHNDWDVKTEDQFYAGVVYAYIVDHILEENKENNEIIQRYKQVQSWSYNNNPNNPNDKSANRINISFLEQYEDYLVEQKYWCCTIKVDIENSKGQYIEKDKQEATKDGSESTKIQHGI